MSVVPQVAIAAHLDALVLRPIGEFDVSTVDTLRSTFLDAVTPEHHKVVLDLSATTFVDSMTLGVMVGISRYVHDRDGWVRLAGPHENIRSVLRLTGLDKVFGIYETVEDAVSDQAGNAQHGPTRLTGEPEPA